MKPRELSIGDFKKMTEQTPGVLVEENYKQTNQTLAILIIKVHHNIFFSVLTEAADCCLVT